MSLWTFPWILQNKQCSAVDIHSKQVASSWISPAYQNIYWSLLICVVWNTGLQACRRTQKILADHRSENYLKHFKITFFFALPYLPVHSIPGKIMNALHDGKCIKNILHARVNALFLIIWHIKWNTYVPCSNSKKHKWQTKGSRKKHGICKDVVVGFHTYCYLDEFVRPRICVFYSIITAWTVYVKSRIKDIFGFQYVVTFVLFRESEMLITYINIFP